MKSKAALKTITLCALLLLNSRHSLAFESLSFSSPMMDAGDFHQKTDFGIDAYVALVDAAITSYPPDQTTYDRNFLASFRILQNFVFSPRFALRLNIHGLHNIYKSYEKEEPRRLKEANWWEARPSIDLTYSNGAGIEIFAGATYWYLSEYNQETMSVSFNEVSHFSDVNLLVPRGGILRRGANFVGGLYYQAPASEDRRVSKSSSDNSKISTSQEVYAPTEYALFSRGQFAKTKIDVELAAVQASEGGPRAGEKQGRIYDDYVRARLGVDVAVVADSRLKIGISHKTLSYADSAYVGVESIPMTTLNVNLLQGSASSHYYVGLIYARGDDTQSLPEFNQKFVVNTYGASAGFTIDL